MTRSYDFVLVAGDDVTDENMFMNLPSEVFKIKVGKKKTAADYFIRNHTNLISLLSKLS